MTRPDVGILSFEVSRDTCPGFCENPAVFSSGQSVVALGVNVYLEVEWDRIRFVCFGFWVFSF